MPYLTSALGYGYTGTMMRHAARFLAVATLLALIAGNAFGALAPRYRRERQEEAQVHVVIDVRSVESVERQPARGRGEPYQVSRVTAVVTAVHWGADRLEPQQLITIEYLLRGNFAPGSNNPPRLEANRSYPAFLDWDEDYEVYEPAAGADSFRDLVQD